MGQHPELQAEQAFIDRAYDRVEALRAAARATLDDALKQRGGTFQAVEQREVVVHTTLQRLNQLDIGRESLIFGRIDRDDGDTFHIGRLAVSAEDQEPLVVDWRAPVAEPFYRATGRHPMGLTRRRHFASEGRRLLGIEDEVFALSGDGSAGNGNGDSHGDDDYEPVGTSALLAALERSRSGQMRDIVATVQKEQDEVIRAELPGVLVVQGGPGTGKTAVALHRAAYLIYTYRFPLERQGVLVVGPNPLFLRYIGQVLPSLGESGVALTTIEGLVTDVRARGVDSPAATRVKGDARMARVLSRAVRDRQRPLRRDIAVGYGSTTLRLTVADSEQIVAQARRRPGPHNSRRRAVETLVTRRLQQQYASFVERTRTPEEGSAVMGDADLARELRRLPVIAEALDRMWPVLLAEELVHDLFGAPPLIALAGRGTLSPEECAALARPRSSSLEAIPWTPADLPLLDEARVLLGARKHSPDDDVRAYGHIVVDEAQDLTPMQLRMLNRRSISGSMTVVGDIAQATGHRAPSSWDEILEHLPTRRPPRVVELSVNYRTPAEIMELAGRVLAEAAPHLRRPRSVRSTEMPPRIVQAAPGELGAAVAEAVREEAGRVGTGTRAVIFPPSMRESLAASLREAGLQFGEADADGLDEAVTLVPVDIVKGLEFDGVVVVEPAQIVEEAPQGLRALYVALTRATKVLTVVHTGPLPQSLISQ
ncbi:MAG TPA: AAA family ATPase [Acidimicrobiales bacterium]|nr:AAA family ATPase [Acidimicrobiales bacterium]